MTAISVRPATLADFDAMCGLWETLDEHHRRARPEMFRIPSGVRREEAWVAKMIEGPDSAIFVAVRNGALAGLVTLLLHRPAERRLHIARPFVEIDNIITTEAARRTGVAKAMMEAARAWAASHDIRGLKLTVYEFNEDALSFYKVEGFETLSRQLTFGV